MKIYIDREESTIQKEGHKADTYSYFSYLNTYIKYGSKNGDVIINLPLEFEIYINGSLRWKK